MLYNSVLFQYLNVSSCIVWSYVALIPNVNFKRGDSLLTNLFCLLLFFAWYAVWSTRCRADTFRSSLSSFLILRKSRSVYSYFSLKGSKLWKNKQMETHNCWAIGSPSLFSSLPVPLLFTFSFSLRAGDEFRGEKFHHVPEDLLSISQQ